MSGEHFYIRNGLAHNVLSEMADVFEDEQLDGISPDMPDTRYCRF